MKNIKKILILLSFLMIVFLFMGTVSAANWTVNPGGSIQSIINNASANDTIIVNDNNGSAYTYTENVVINKTLQLQAKTGGNVTIQALNSSMPVFTVNPGGSGSLIQGFTVKGATGSHGIYLNSANNCNIIGNSLTGNQYGIFLSNSSSNTIFRNIVKNSSSVGIDIAYNSTNNTIQNNTVTSNNYGIYVYNSSSNVISENTVTNNTNTGIDINNSSNNNTIQNNTIANNTYYGILIYVSSNSNTIQNNTVTGSTYVGIDIVNNSNGNTIQNNTATNNTNGIYIYNSTSNLISGNTVTNNTNGIVIDTNSTNNIVQNNNITNNSWDGIRFINSNNNILTGNTVTGNTAASGIYFYYSNNNTINGNTITNNAYGLYLYSSSPTINFNRITGNSVCGLYGSVGSGTVNAINNWWGSNNNPVISPSSGSDIYNTAGAFDYSPWLVLTVTARPTSNNGNSTVTADLTHNYAGSDTSSQGHVIDNLPVSFTTNLGIIASPFYTKNGQANATFNRGTSTSGTATITATLDRQSTSTSVIIDMTAPTVTANLPGGVYNTTQVTLTATDNFDTNPRIYYSLNNGTTWNSQAKTVTLNLNQGKTSLMFYAVDAAGNIGATQTNNYTIDITSPTVTANLPGGVYNTTQVVTLTATDNLDPNPTIYYTINGTTPTTSSTRYTGPITITTPSTTALKFMAVDNAGNQASVQTVNYTLNLISNVNTGKNYTHIQDAINDPSTLNGHVITVQSGTYTENIVVNKQLTIRPVSGANAIIQALNSSNPVITVNSGGSGSTVQGFTIKGANQGIYLNSTNNCIISGNTISNNQAGVYSYNSSYNEISDNNILNNTGVGIDFLLGNNNTISCNNITFNGNGVEISRSFNNTFSSNTVSYNTWIGFYTFDDSEYMNYINFNRIAQNGECGIYSEGGVFNATNNWWSSNNPIEGFCYGDDIAIDWGTVYYDPWLVLSISSSSDNITHGTSSNVTADLTHNNQGNDTSSSGSVPDGIPINFTATIGTITSPLPTRNGKSVSTLNPNAISGIANVSVILDRQTVSKTINIIDIYNNRTQIGFNSIQAAINDASTLNGDTIIVGTGTYTENIIVNKTLTLMSVSGANVTIQALDSSNPVITVNSGGNGSVIQGFAIKGATNSKGIYLNMTSNCNITGNILIGNHYGIYTYNSSNNLISGNTATNSSLVGIDIAYSSNNNTIQNNTVTGCQYGIYLYSSNINTIQNNTVTNNTYYGILIYANSNNNNVQNNTVTGSTYAGIDIVNNSNGNTIQNNTATSNASGIYVYNSSSNLISGNIVTNSSSAGIVIDNNSTNNIVQNNTATSNQYGIYITNSTSNTIQNNTVTNNTNTGIFIINNSTNNQVQYNTVTGNSSYGIAVSGSSNNAIQNNNLSNNYIAINVYSSNNNTIHSNSITNNFYGIYLGYANNIIITGNSITGGTYGINPQYSTANINFNRINGCSSFGLVSQCNSIINAVNNWWGTNTPSYISSPDWISTYYDIYNSSGTVNATSWLVLSISSSSDNIIHGGPSNITADLTHNNQGNDTSSSGSVPDGIPINFTATIGTINSPVPTRNGKSVSILNPNAISGLANVSATLDRQTVSKTVNIIDIYNNRTQIGFNSIQAAINDASTLNGDAIIVGTGTYTENIVLNKTLTLKSVSGGTVTIQALNSSNPVFTINSFGSGSVIQGFTIKGATGSNGIYLNGASNCNITGNTLTGNYNALNLNNSTNNTIQNNVLTHNSWIAIELNYSNNNTIKNNKIETNYYGIHLGNSYNETIIENTIFDNTYGINPQYSTATIQFNRITFNSRYGLVNQYNSIINATNNWWYTNNPVNSENYGSALCISGGTVTYNPWLSADIGFALNFTSDNIKDAAGYVKTYIETNHALPSSVTISGKQVTMPKFLKLATTTLLNITCNYPFLLTYGSCYSSETMVSGILNSTEYTTIANNVNSYMDSNGYTPPYAVSSLGNIRYESLVYMYSQILNSYNINGASPDFITVNPWSVISDTNNAFFTTDQVTNASGTVKSYIETNHALPSSITISGKQVSMPQFLKLATTTLLNIEGNFYASTPLQSYGTSPNPTETITGKNMGYSEYGTVASNVMTYMNVFGLAPNSTATSFGNMRYESLVYTYSQILNYYNSTGYLPANITVNPWSTVSDTSTVFFTGDQINIASGMVKSYIEANHQLPSSITISGKQLTMPQFLQLSTEEILNITGDLCTSFVPRNYGSATAPAENITSGNIGYTEYINITGTVNSFMNSNGYAPNNITSSLGNIRYESLVYMYVQLLNSYYCNNGTLPDYITLNPWSVVSNPNTIFLSMDQINNASGTVKPYVDTNLILPGSVTIAGVQVNMPQFLELATTTLLNIEGNLNTSIILKSTDKFYMSTEDIVSGDIQNDEYTDIAQYLKNYIDVNGTAPDAYQTSLGTHMGCPSLIYMYSQILNYYNINNKTLPDSITITPWIAITNPNAIYNYQSNKVFNSLQAAIDDNDTINGETIGIGISTVTENVIVNKTLSIMSIPTVKVTVQAADPNLPVFTITTYGSGSIIQDLIINGSTNNAGIYINNSFYNTISEDVISGNNNGIYIDNSTDNEIADSEILNNTANGIFINTGSDNNTITGNTLSNNGMNGINVNDSEIKKISNNIILNNGMNGIYLNNSSANVNFNRIFGNAQHGLYNTGNGTVDAENNWWGTNTPNISLNNPSDIGINGGAVNCDQWLVLNLTSSCDRSNRTGTTYNYIITADLTHNNLGRDTSSGNGPSNGKSQGDTLPDEIPVNFTATLGTINTPVSTRNGKSVATLNSTIAGLASVTVTLDNQTFTIPVNVISVNVLGIYNNRTGENFTSIQSAIDSNNTLDGDIITLADGTYTENVVVYKQLAIKPVSGANVTVQAADSNKGVFTVIKDGSTIQNLNIIGAANSYGILGYANNLNITGNTITANNNGIMLFNSNNTTITGNSITNNLYGSVLYNSASITLTGNTITDNWYGNMLYNSTSTNISGNNITDNWYGIFSNIANNTTIFGNIITDNNAGIFISNSNSITISGNTITNNGGGISYYQSNNITTSGNTITDNWIVNSSLIDTSGVVLESNIWNCGPASLATVMSNMGFNVTDEELASLAGTDKFGTTMYGLVQATQVKGLNATGMILSVSQLKPNYIVLLTVDGLYHFSVIKSINNTTVSLADSSFGNINITLDSFTAQYSGYALIITNNSTNNTTNGTPLTNEQMKTLRGTQGYINVGSLFQFGGEGLGAVVRGVCLPVGIVVTLATLPTVGGKDEMNAYYTALRANGGYQTIDKNGNIKFVKYNPINMGSSAHGSNPTKKQPKYKKPKSLGNKYIGGGSGSYVSPSKGYVNTPTVNQADLEYQRMYEEYLNKKASELNKIQDTLIDPKTEKNNDRWFLNQQNKRYKQGVPKPQDGDEGTFLTNLYKWSKSKIDSGINEIKAGNYAKGTADIALGTGGIHVWGSYLIDTFWPEGLPPK